jgi:protein phosphatase
LKVKVIDYICDVGLTRSTNEDCLKIDNKNGLVIVSDGMGGYSKGDIASQIVCDKFYDDLKELSSNEIFEDETLFINMLKVHLTNAIHQSTHEIIDYAKKYNMDGVIGATVGGVYFDDNLEKLAIFHMGDTRIYRIRDNTMEQMMDDHVVDDFINKKNNTLTKAIGNFELFDIELSSHDVISGDKFVICTDGVYNFIDNKQIYDIILQNDRDICENIKNRIYENGAKDNLTIVIVGME